MCKSRLMWKCGRALLGAAWIFSLWTLQAADSATNRFGFTGPEIFPLDTQGSGLHAADLDGDGLLDLVVVDNARSKIDLLYNQTGKTNAASLQKARKREINELPPDARFR